MKKVRKKDERENFKQRNHGKKDKKKKKKKRIR